MYGIHEVCPPASCGEEGESPYIHELQPNTIPSMKVGIIELQQDFPGMHQHSYWRLSVLLSGKKFAMLIATCPNLAMP